MARATHFTKGYLCNVEAGRRPVTPAVVLAYERVLGEDDMQRRSLITGLAASVVAPVAVGELIGTGFNAALGQRISVDDWEGRSTALGIDYMTVGAADLQQRLARDLVLVQQHLDSPRMWVVAARLLTTYGKTATNRREAVRWYKVAAQVADRSDDTATRVWVRGRAALALGYEAAELPTAKDLAQQALDIDDRPTLGRLNALTALAHIAGVRGDRNGALSTLEQARRVFDRAGSEEQISDFAVPEWRFHTFASMLLSRLGDPGAVDEQDSADRTRPTTLPRFATHIEMHRALMLVRQGDVDTGRGYARSALDRLPPD